MPFTLGAPRGGGGGHTRAPSSQDNVRDWNTVVIKRKCFLQWHLVFFFSSCAQQSRCGVAFPLLLNGCMGEKRGFRSARCCIYMQCADAVALLFNHLLGSACWACHLLAAPEVMSGDWQENGCGGRGGFHRCSETHRGGHSLSLVGRGFFSFVSVFFSFVLSKRLISVMSGLSDILAARNEVGEKKIHLSTQAWPSLSAEWIKWRDVLCLTWFLLL